MSPAERDLEAPLLEKESGSNDAFARALEKTVKAQQQAEDPVLPKETTQRLNLLSFGTGAFVGLLAQVILEATIWDRAILGKPTPELIKFSLVWSLLTCVIVNCAMAIFIRDTKASYRPERCTDEAWRGLSIAMEAYVIGGALVSISAWWLTLDLAGVVLPISTSSVVILVIAATILYIVSFASVLPTTGKGWWSTVVASILGLSIGFGSQFLLSLVLWTGHMPKPALSSLLLFSVVWSGCTVLLTFTGCMALRFCKPAANKDAVAAERTYLRMESFYVLCALVGICFAWITLDMLLGLTQQIMPSLLMLLLSLIIFRAILYCFPEDKCLEEFEETNELALKEAPSDESA